MMTFLVVADFVENAKYLDNRRLGKQRSEGLIILNTLMAMKRGETPKGWGSHPAVLAWVGHLNALRYYLNCIIEEWVARGFKNEMPLYKLPKKIKYPWWISWDLLHESHRAMLLRKERYFYEDKFEVHSSDLKILVDDKLVDCPRDESKLIVRPEIMRHGYIWPHELKPSIIDRQPNLAKICAPIPEDLKKPRYCMCLTRQGKVCGILLRKNAEACGVHARTARTNLETSASSIVSMSSTERSSSSSVSRSKR